MAGAAEGGAELFFERLCIGLHDAGDTVLPVIRRNAARADTLRKAGLSPVELAFGPPVDLLTRLRLRTALRDFAPEVAVFWMNRANQHRMAGPWISVGRLGGYYPMRHYRGCDHLVGNTTGIVAWLRDNGWSAERSHYLPNFVDDLADAVAADRAALGIGAKPPMLLGLGRLHTDKGFDTVIRGLASLPDAEFVIAGSGPEEERLRRLAAVTGVARRVHFLGWRRDVGALLKAADVFVCSSRVEPLGNMVIEAWSAGRPVVAAAAAGPRELIRDGETGLIVPMNDPPALATAIARVLRDPARAARLALAGREQFERHFSRDAVIGQWQTFMRQAADRLPA